MSRNAAPSVIQMEKLICIMEENRWLANGHARTTHARDRTRAAWKEAALKLNTDEGGCIKSWQQWAKYWKDKKAAIKKKAIQIRMARLRPVVSDADEQIVLSKFEERVVALTGGSFNSGNKGQVNAFSQPVNGHRSVVGVVEMAEESDEATDFDLHPGPSWRGDNQVNSEQDDSRIPPASDDPLAASSQRDNRRRFLMGRRRLIRRSQISDLTERLMALEERSLEVEKSQAEIRRIEAETLRLQAVNQRETIDIFRQIGQSFQELVEHIVRK